MPRWSNDQPKPWCSICGQDYPDYTEHRCSQRTLNIIDGMHAAATTEPEPEPKRRKSDGQRLADGFAMAKASNSEFYDSSRR